MAELPDATYDRIKALCATGDALAKQGRFRDAIKRYEAAWQLLPEPRKDWNAATWILAAIGDAHYLSGEFALGRDILLKAMQCPGALGNPFFHLRLGQCQFELGDLPKAGDELTRAYMGGGGKLFRRENPRYYAHLKTILKPPPAGWD